MNPPNLFVSRKYLKDQAFGGTKYAGLRLLQRLRDVETIPRIYSPGFGFFDRLISSPFGVWLREAERHRDNIMRAYMNTLQGGLGNPVDVEKAAAFFGQNHFDTYKLGSMVNKELERLVSDEHALIEGVLSFAEGNPSAHFFRSSADIEDRESNTAGLFKTIYASEETLGDRDSIIYHLSWFYGSNIGISLFTGRKARLNFVLHPAFECESGGVGLSPYGLEGGEYLETSHDPSVICGGTNGTMAVINGTLESFIISLVGELSGENKPRYIVQGVPSFSSQDQITATLSLLQQLRKRIGLPINIEYLHQSGQTKPTIVQVRRYTSLLPTEYIDDASFQKANHATVVGVKPGQFSGPLYNLPFCNESGGYNSTPDFWRILREIDAKNTGGYVLVGDRKMVSGTMRIDVAPYSDHFYVHELIIDLIRRLCLHATVFVNTEDSPNRGGHDPLNLASDASQQFYLSIPELDLKDGTLVDVRSDGQRGILNIK